MEHPDGRRCIGLYVITGTPYGKMSVFPFDYEYIVLVQGTRVIYCPNPYVGDGQMMLCMN